jgi:hypothetical protein
MWTRYEARLDLAPKKEIGVRCGTPGRSNRRHAGCEIETRRRVRHVDTQRRSVEGVVAPEIRPRLVPEMIVHADDARHHRGTAQIEDGGSGRWRFVSAIRDRRDDPAFDRHGLIGARRGTGAVDDSHMFEHDASRRRSDVLQHV